MTPPLPQPTVLERVAALERSVAELRTSNAAQDQEIAALKATVASLTDTNTALARRITALEAPPNLQPKPTVPADQQGLPIPPKRLREPEHAPARTVWGDLGLFDPSVDAIVETATGAKPDPQRPPKQPGYLDRLRRPGIS